jgi:hypothetical protein
MFKFISILLFVFYYNYSSAQTAQFDITGHVPGAQSPVITSWQNDEGTLLIWNKPGGFIGRPESKLWMYRIKRDGEKIIDSGNVYIKATIRGRKDVTPYGIVLIGKKLYALMLCRIDKIVDVYADEIETHDLSLIGNPIKIFQYRYSDLYGAGFLTMFQSDDQSKTMFFVNESDDPYGMNIIHTISYGADINNHLWDRKDSVAFPLNPVIGNNGVAVFNHAIPIYAGMKRVVEKDTKTLLYITTISQKGIIRRQIPLKEYYIATLKTVISPENKVICCGLFSDDKMMLKSNGVFYISLDPDVEKYSEIKTVDFKTQTPTIESLSAYAMCKVLVSEQGALWVIAEKQYGINSSSTYGNIFVCIFDAKGAFKTALLINKEVKVRQPGAGAFVARPTFSAQLYDENLYCFFTDENEGLTAATVTPNGELKYDRIKSSKPGEAKPADDEYFCTPIRDGECYIICRASGKKAPYELGRFHF